MRPLARTGLKAKSPFTLRLTIFSVLSLFLFQGYFITDNKSVNKFANEVLKVALSGLSLTVISFTIVFLVRHYKPLPLDTSVTRFGEISYSYC